MDNWTRLIVPVAGVALLAPSPGNFARAETTAPTDQIEMAEQVSPDGDAATAGRVSSPKLVSLPNHAIFLITAGAPEDAPKAAETMFRQNARGRFAEAFEGVDIARPLIATAYVTWGRATDLVGRPIDFAHPIRLPGARTRVTLAGLSRAALPSIMPVATTGLTSGFGMRAHPLLGTWRAHLGVDLAAASGTPIVATSDGIVGLADWRGGYGLSVALEHGGGIETRYGHMSRLNVTTGQAVHKGDVIGFVGSTGMSTGPHLHYEVRLNGQPVNPASLFNNRR